MNKLQKMAGIGALVAALSGCENKELELEKSEPTQPKPELFVYGTIVKERGTAEEMMDSNWHPFGTQAVRSSDLIYIIQIQTDNGLYTAKVYDNTNYDHNRILEALALAIDEGTRVKIRTWDFEYAFKNREDKIGVLYTNQIFIDEQVQKK